MCKCNKKRQAANSPGYEYPIFEDSNSRSTQKDDGGGMDGFGDITTGDISLFDNMFSDNDQYSYSFNTAPAPPTNNTIAIIVIVILLFATLGLIGFAVVRSTR